MARWLVTRFGYPVILGAAAFGCFGAHRMGFSPWISVGAVSAISALLLTFLERTVPFTPKWAMNWRAVRIDALHSLVTAGLAAPLARAGLLTLAAIATVWLSGALGSSLWPSSWPLVVQVGLAVLASDLGAYVAHRSMHVFEAGWRIHVVHHSSSALNWLASGRSHPFNGMWTFGFETGALVLLGAPEEVLLITTAIKSVNGMLQHANVDFHPGWLSYWLATNEVHWWHHARDEVKDVNFGNTTAVWDILFGTFYLPRDRRPSTAVGLADVALPESYLWHLASPFILNRFLVKDESATAAIGAERDPSA